MSSVAIFVLGLILIKCAVQLWLESLNRRHVLAHAGAVPDALKEAVDEATYAKSVQYTLAKAKLRKIELVYDATILIALLGSGVLPWAYTVFTQSFGVSAWALSFFLAGLGIVLSLPRLPMDWYAQFRLEERFGFNTSTHKVWWMDRFKGLVLGLVLGCPLLALILKLMQWAGPRWWL